MTGMPSSIAFLFFPDVEAASLLMSAAVFFDTEPASFPPLSVIYSENASRFANVMTLPVIT